MKHSTVFIEKEKWLQNGTDANTCNGHWCKPFKWHWYQINVKTIYGIHYLSDCNLVFTSKDKYKDVKLGFLKNQANTDCVNNSVWLLVLDALNAWVLNMFEYYVATSGLLFQSRQMTLSALLYRAETAGRNSHRICAVISSLWDSQLVIDLLSIYWTATAGVSISYWCVLDRAPWSVVGLNPNGIVFFG